MFAMEWTQLNKFYRVTNTCQPQCRNSVLNLYQNRLGRALLRTDVSCIPGRYELELCHLIPNREPIYCNLAKLACEADLMCSSRYGIFASECEVEATHGDCNVRCRELMNDILTTRQGSAFLNCTCTDKEDQLCLHLRDVLLQSCIAYPKSTIQPVSNIEMKNVINQKDSTDDGGSAAGLGLYFTSISLLSSLLLFLWNVSFI